MYNPDLLYMEANLEEDRLPGVEPGNPVHIKLRRLPRAPFRGRVVWVNKSTGHTVRTHAEERGFRRSLLHVVCSAWRYASRSSETTAGRTSSAGLSGTVGIAHGSGDAAWAAWMRLYRAMKDLEMQYNAVEKSEASNTDGNASTEAARP